MLLQGSQGDSKNAKKKNNKKTNKNKSSISRANKKKPSMPNVSNDLSQKLYATMEKHKEVETGGGRGRGGGAPAGSGGPTQFHPGSQGPGREPRLRHPLAVARTRAAVAPPTGTSPASSPQG